MSTPLPNNLLLSPWKLHTTCGLVALLACVPLLWPELAATGDPDDPLFTYAGWALGGALTLSAVVVALQLVHILLKLHNLRAFLHLLAWLGQWGLAYGAFVLLALVADVPPPLAPETGLPIQETDTLHLPQEELTGPAALVIPITPEDYAPGTVQTAPALCTLAHDYEALLAHFLELSPRWTDHRNDDTFYSKPGHVVMVPPTPSGTPALVHVGFRQLVEGDPLPRGYTVVKPGDKYPAAGAGSEQAVSDIALDLGGSHYLMLAWRGAPHAESAQRALNAAIAAVDTRLQRLIDAEDKHATVEQMTRGKEDHPGTTPDIRLCEPPSQSGTYQAEIYANPLEDGSLQVTVSDLETGEVLRSFRCEARYSDNDREIFRHDLPLSRCIWVQDDSAPAVRELLPPGTPLFAIRKGEPHHFFGVAVEVFFMPTDPSKPQRRLLRRCYKVQACEKPAPPETPVLPSDHEQEALTPAPEPEKAGDGAEGGATGADSPTTGADGRQAEVSLPAQEADGAAAATRTTAMPAA